MGEVYRADDLELEQPVALKFLPESLTLDPRRLALFRDEVRIARQVSHRNVCRVYDIGEIKGLYYLSMEYVDGEDLASLLRRIGRLPVDKGVEIARQLCAGLAAAHEKGFIHRDLKPANVMIDGRGVVRIMDFGLAALAEDVQGNREFAGTPAYMAPEQFRGQEASIRSDFYALGLIFYEIFTGKPVYKGGTPMEIARQQRESSPASPSSLVGGLDPAIERVILNCLETAPELRPASAIAVAAALPGGDPLAAALAAGETPSPELVAASGKQGALQAGRAWAILGGVLFAIGLTVLTSRQVLLTGRMTFPKPPAVFIERARETIKTLGHTEPPLDSASGFSANGAFLRHVAAQDSSNARWRELEARRPGAAFFWYRESPEHLIAREVDGEVDRTDPPQVVPGMRQVRLDLLGRLIYFDAVPPQADTLVAARTAPDWAALFSAAGLDAERFAPTDSMWTPPVYCDTLAAWEGSFAEDPGTAVRVEAGAYRGKPVYFRILGPWSRPAAMGAGAVRAGIRASQVLNVVLVLAAMIGAGLIVRRNLRQGQGDLRGASRLALFVLTADMLSWLLGADHVPSPADELNLFVRGVGDALFFAAFLWLLYMALEPTVRRRWPERIISWSRLLTGRFRDPLVGRDILLGTLCGTASMLVAHTVVLSQIWTGQPPPVPNPSGLGTLGSAAAVLSALFHNQVVSLMNALFFVFFPLLLFIVFRKLWLAIGLFWAVLVVMFTAATGNMLIALAPGIAMVGLWIFAALRLGLLASSATFFTFFVLQSLPMTTDTSAWFLGQMLLGVGAVVLLALFGFRTAVGK